MITITVEHNFYTFQEAGRYQTSDTCCGSDFMDFFDDKIKALAQGIQPTLMTQRHLQSETAAAETDQNVGTADRLASINPVQQQESPHLQPARSIQFPLA